MIQARLARFVAGVAAEEGSFWIRLLYLYPDTFPDLSIAGEDPRLVPYFDLSFQHASPRILRRMGRPGEVSQYLDLIARIRDRLPDVALRSSFIVGFPGEEKDDVTQLIDFLQRAQLEWVGVFGYSPQEGTRAARWVSECPPPEEVVRRRELVLSIQQPIVTNRLSRFVGRTVPVLIEEPFEDGEYAIGRSPLQAPDVDGVVVVHVERGGVRAGQVIQARVEGVTEVDMQARYVGE